MEAPPLRRLSAGRLSLSWITVNNGNKTCSKQKLFYYCCYCSWRPWPSPPNFHLCRSSAETVLLADCSTGGTETEKQPIILFKLPCRLNFKDERRLDAFPPHAPKPTKLEAEMAGPFVRHRSKSVQSNRENIRGIIQWAEFFPSTEPSIRRHGGFSCSSTHKESIQLLMCR